MFVGAAEMGVAVSLFDRSCAESAPSCSPTNPRWPLADRESLYTEILTDEVVGTSATAPSRCTPAERAIMRRLYPRIARLFARQTYEISLLTESSAASRPPRPAIRRRGAHRRPI